ncbi:hypothetical protein OZX61_10065 [Acinetobacter sp. ESL0695]|uniref:hypothetical protein n=1 Tax=Acinetobacter sp. ESL0695 TaxID=2983215 RepID=UPI0023EFF512|nr:hypothetical protein [Acinetobacter sp. ESL0695]WEV48591.1 hypothetical protein OZX61_10065 [Acinetobacter sp. ESL0695]
MANYCWKIYQKSKIKRFFWSVILFITIYTIYQLLEISYVLALNLLLFLTYILYEKNNKNILEIAQLDNSTWTMLFENNDIKKIKVTCILNHYLYFSIYTNDSKDNFIIWRDQISPESLKQIINFSKLYNNSTLYDLNDMK